MAYEEGSVITTKVGILCVQHDSVSASFVVSGPATGVKWPTMTAWPLVVHGTVTDLDPAVHGTDVNGTIAVTDPGPVLAVFNYPTSDGAIGSNGCVCQVPIGREAARKAAYDYCNNLNVVVMRAEWPLQGPANKKLIQDALNASFNTATGQ
jgi:hypothetical protein